MLPTEYEEFERFLKASICAMRSTAPPEDTVKIWFTALRRYSLDDIKKAWMRWIDNNDRVPSPAAIKEILRERLDRDVAPPPVLNIQCAWIDKDEDGVRLQRCNHFSTQTMDGAPICTEHRQQFNGGTRATAGAFV